MPDRVGEASQINILVVDDQLENYLIIQSIFAEYNVVYATCGAQAIDFCAHQEFAVILLDYDMPEMNGFEVARRIKRCPKSQNIPIIFVTGTQSSEQKIIEAYELGAVDYIAKPFHLTVLRSKVRVFAELFRRSREPRRHLSKVSHKLRTPLGAILGFAELLLNPLMEPSERAECFSTIRRNGEQLLRIIDEVLDLSKVEAGQMTVEHIEVLLDELLSGLRNSMELQATRKGLTLQFLTLGSLPRRILTDPVRIRQILINVISNAIQFTSDGHVTVTTLFEPTCGEEGMVRFVISDTGPGLTPEQAQPLFEPFVQADTTRPSGSTGTGLALSKKLAEALGGGLKLRSTRCGEGSCFEVFVPTGPVALQKPAPPAPALSLFRGAPADHLDNVRILLVEDSPDNQVLIARFLKMAGAKVDLAVNGLEAVQMATKGVYDIVLMDIQMPLLDGYEATSRLRSLGYGRPIVALTAHAMKEERERCLNMGCNAHLTKPIDRQHLIAALQSFVTERASLCSH